jgi:DNA-binding MarR family transcriptional regulator
MGGTKEVKKLDEMEEAMVDVPPEAPPDHIGWALWQAAQAWKSAFVRAMVGAGHAWFGQARGNLLQHIGASGIRQADLAARAGLTKQAVQQFVDELAADGIVVRVQNSADARARCVVLTDAGHAAMHDARRIKIMIEDDWRRHLGDADFAALDRLLRRLGELSGPDSGLPRFPQDERNG